MRAHAAVPADWPLVEHSCFHDAGAVRWHAQRLGPPGAAPSVLLLHGTGASTHAWRHVAKALASEAEVLAVDLPGHGFSTMLSPERSDSRGVAGALAALLDVLNVRPDLLVGHSAGAAVALRLVLGGAVRVPVLAVNGAVVALGGLPGRLFAPAARMVAERGLIASLLARRARRPAAVARVLASTGSRYSSEDVRLYQRLLLREGHVRGVLRMMANWDLPDLEAALGAVDVPVRLLFGAGDGTLPRGYAQRVATALEGAVSVQLEGCGHLAQEEDPARIADEIRTMLGGCVRDRAGDPGACATVASAGVN